MWGRVKKGVTRGKAARPSVENDGETETHLDPSRSDFKEKDRSTTFISS